MNTQFCQTNEFETILVSYLSICYSKTSSYSSHYLFLANLLFSHSSVGLRSVSMEPIDDQPMSPSSISSLSWAWTAFVANNLGVDPGSATNVASTSGWTQLLSRAPLLFASDVFLVRLPLLALELTCYLLLVTCYLLLAVVVPNLSWYGPTDCSIAWDMSEMVSKFINSGMRVVCKLHLTTPQSLQLTRLVRFCTSLRLPMKSTTFDNKPIVF